MQRTCRELFEGFILRVNEAILGDSSLRREGPRAGGARVHITESIDRNKCAFSHAGFWVHTPHGKTFPRMVLVQRGAATSCKIGPKCTDASASSRALGKRFER